MKKILSLILAMSMLFSVCAVLASCNGGNGGSTTEGTTVEVETTNTETTTTKPVDPETTEAPTTDAPETNAPETNAPETNAPETNAPETNAPETDAPETNAPETDAPETDAPETDAPETNAPETDAPETDAPETDAPETDAPDFDLTIEEAIALVSPMANGKFTDEKYYVTGTVTSIFLASKGGIIIADDKGNTIRVTSTFNKDGSVGFAQMESKPAVGDRVVLYGVIAKYGNSAQMKDARIMEFGVPEEPDFDLTVEEALALVSPMANGQFTEEKYYVTATVKSIYLPAKGSMILTDEDGNTIRINVSYNEDGTVGFAQMTQKPVVGDKIVIYGVIGKYNGSVQMNDGWIIEFGEQEETGSADNETETKAPAVDDPTTPDDPGSDHPTTPDAPTHDGTDKYNNGAEISAAGAKWETGFFPNIKHTVDTSKAVLISAEELLAKLKDRDGASALKKGEVWMVTDQLVLESGCKYYGNGAAIIAAGGILIKDAVDIVIKDIIIRGTLTIENSAEIILFKVDIESSATTVSIDEKSSDITFKTTRIRGNDASVVSFADCVTIYNCYIYSHNGLRLTGDEVIVQSCRIFASLNAVYISGSDCVVRENSIETVDIGSAVTVYKSTNALVALNAIKGSQDTIKVTESFNCSVVLNSAICITGTDNTNLYVIENSLGGYLHLENNNYLIAEDNTYPLDGLNHAVINKNNENKNGDSVTNVDHRVEVGANEDLLPHTNKELFVGMNRKSTVADASLAVDKSFGSYVKDLATEQSIIIVPPGAYVSNSPISLRAEHNNTKIYAYGVYQEYAETDPAKVDNLSLFFVGVDNVSVFGLTIGHTLPSSGQVRVIEKIKEGSVYKLKVVADAGYLDGFTTTDPDIYHTWWPEFFLTDEDGTQKDYPEENQKSAHTTEYNYDENGNYDGTMTITLRNKGTGNEYSEGKTAKALWDKVEVGNVVTCRIVYASHKELNGSLIYLQGCSNITFRDTVTYGSAGGMCVFTGNLGEGVTFTRQHNTTKTDTVIDKETYERYRAIEEQYNVDMEVREEVLEDGTIRYRGPHSRSGSVDAFHITSSKQGVSITSSLLEGMVDDGSNQKSNSSRLHGYEINGDGTITLYYKQLVSAVYWNNSTTLPSNELGMSSCMTFSKGDRIFIFTPEGRTFCDTTVLEAWKEATANASYKTGVEIDLTYNGVNKHLWIDLYAVKVNIADVDMDALISPVTGEEYDLTDNGYELTNRLSVDNLSKNCCNYTLDNVMVRNGHSRGFLIKAIGVTIKHCTFRNVSNAGLLITIEPEYGETTIARDILIQQCLFDNTGYNYGEYDALMQSCIVIKGTSTVISEHTLPVRDITITGCKFTNNKQKHAIWVNSAQNIKITNNTFDPIVKEMLQPINTRGVAIYLDTCMNVEISDNTYNLSGYNANGGNIKSVIYGTQYKNIFGTDVMNEDGTPIYPDQINETK